MRSPEHISFFGCLLLLCLQFVDGSSFLPVQFKGNGNLQRDLTAEGNTFPRGYTTLGGVPFLLKTDSSNFWCAEMESGPNPRVLSIPVKLGKVKAVHTLMNLYWGSPHDSLLSCIEFFGSNNTYHKVALVADKNIRDFDGNPPSFSDNLDTAFANEVFSNGKGQRLDKQNFVLPEEFGDENLTEIRITDNGATGVQRVFLYGVTADINESDTDPCEFQTVPFLYNGRLQNSLYSLGDGYPRGDTVLAGVPFSIPDTGLNWWHASSAAGENPRILSVPVNRYAVKEVYTLINTFWGKHLDSTMASVEFEGTKTVYRIALYTGKHIRDFDYLDEEYENSIDSGITTIVYDNGSGQLLDCQKLILPMEFLTDTLKEIRIIDRGAENVQRIFVYGITICYGPEAVNELFQRKPEMRNRVPLELQKHGKFLIDGRVVVQSKLKGKQMLITVKNDRKAARKRIGL